MYPSDNYVLEAGLRVSYESRRNTSKNPDLDNHDFLTRLSTMSYPPFMLTNVPSTLEGFKALQITRYQNMMSLERDYDVARPLYAPN